MQLPRFRFTIRQLIALIAICAVVFALLRTPFGFLVIAFGSVLPGFLIERARGGAGILGGALSACFIVCAGGLAIAVLSGSPPVSNLGDAILKLCSFLYFVSFYGFICGAILSTVLCGIFALMRSVLKNHSQDQTCGPIRRHRLDNGPGQRH